MKKIIFKSSKDENNFVGLKFDKENIIFYLPLGFDYDFKEIECDKITLELKFELIMLLKSINLINSNDNLNDQFGVNVGSISEVPFNSFFG